MSKKLAIRGHATYGKEVIELLEMMGGKNNYKVDGANINCTYVIRHFDHSIIGGWQSSTEIVFTLDEFLKKYPFKVGDKVIDTADGCPGVVCEMKWDEDVSDMKYCVVFGNGIDFGWFANDSIEFCKESKNLEETQSKRDIDKSEFVIKHMILPNKVDDKLEYEIIDGYEFDKVDNNKIILKLIKSNYPKTYEECCEIIEINRHDIEIDLPHPYQQKMFNLFKLCICRDAYWKIAGKQMGLVKSWEPDLKNEELYCIQNYNKQITISRTNTAFNKILIFPSEEMRDAFYENFKDLIEQCKYTIKK